MAFLAMAVLVHAALLMIPLKDWRNVQTAVPTRLTVDLRQLPAVAITDPESGQDSAEPSPEAELPEEPAPALDQRRTASIHLDELPPEPGEAAATEAQPENAVFSAHQLRELVRQSELPEDDGRPVHQLGSVKPWKPPANWQKHAGAPYLAEFENTFNGMTVPEDVEIVDRWMASDGSHNVVVNLPNGDTVCGRAEAYNPMQPLVEPVMMFRPCGGGGKRTFTVPDRYKKGQ